MDLSLQTMVKRKKVHRETANLPSDLIESNIMTRLPVKTLIRFKCACKSWHCLSNPYFLNIYYQIQKRKLTNLVLVQDNYEYFSKENPIVIAHCFSPEQSWSSFTPMSSYNEAIILPEQADTIQVDPVSMVDCCHGLVCVIGSSYNLSNKIHERHISLWNPALRISKVVASSKPRPSLSLYLCAGFGYHNKTNDYNVIMFSKNGLTINHVKIYSLNLIHGGRLIINLISLLRMYELQGLDSVSCYPRGGAYCWLAYKCDEKGYNLGKTPRIISFDMEDETFKEIMLPYDSTNDELCRSQLFVYKDSVAVFYSYMYFDESVGYHTSRLCQIWVMKEYHDPKVWTKLYSFDSKCAYVKFRGVIQNDLIQLLCGDRVGNIGDPIIKEVKVVDIDKSQVYTITCPKIINLLTKARLVTSLTESLISLSEIKEDDDSKKKSCSD